MPPPAPLLGYNNNVRHRGQVFHIQTEDSGVNSPRIMTHLFADGGRIVKSTRTDYSEHLGSAKMVEIVKRLMKEQHKAMFVELRSGALDARIGFEEDAPPPTLSGDAQVLAAAEDITKNAVRAPTGSVPPGSMLPPPPKSVPVGGKSSAPPDGERPYAAPRPASVFSAAAPLGSIFGDVGGLDEKSLDDAILSYLAEDPKADSKPGQKK
jgi:hypothetical protein